MTVQLGEQVAIVSEPYRVQHATRYRQRTKRTYWASCPDCGWHTVSRSLAALRQEARTHPCPERCPVCGER